MTETPEYPEPDEPRETALGDAIHDLAEAFERGDATDETISAAIEAIRQVPIDPQRMLNALHVPKDAGEYEAVLRSLLMRIPDGWGRWISCGPGWYPILAQLDEQLRGLDPDYEIHQIKEKYGTLRFYWAGRNYDKGEQAVNKAEAASARTCESCGNPGEMRNHGSWLRTLCDECAEAQGYAG